MRAQCCLSITGSGLNSTPGPSSVKKNVEHRMKAAEAKKRKSYILMKNDRTTVTNSRNSSGFQDDICHARWCGHAESSNQSMPHWLDFGVRALCRQRL